MKLDTVSARLPLACWLASVTLAHWCVAEETAWTVAHSDGRSRLISSEPFAATMHHGGGQHFRLSPWRGSWSHLIFPVAPAPVIAENAPAVRMKASRPDMLLAVRVVLPRTVNSDSGAPLTIVLEGDAYERPNEWVSLRLPDMARALDRQVRVLRSSHGEIDAKEAYIDLLSLKVFGDGGDQPADLWLCAPNLAQAAGDREITSPTNSSKACPQAACQTGDLLHVDGRHFVPRVIRGHGESWDFLKGLGFNTVAMAVAPTLADAARAERLDLWLVAPPPPPSLSPNARPFERVIAWDLGSNSAEAATIRGWIDRLRDAELGVKRPILCSTDARGDSTAHQADILLHRQWPLGTRLELSEHAAWLSRGLESHSKGNWVAIQTDLPEPVIAQAAAFGARRDRMAPQPAQIELLAAIGAAQGARGFWFDSRARLDMPDQATRVRAAALKLTNERLRRIEPWTTCGEVAGVTRCDQSDYQASLLRLERASLLIVNHLPPGAQRSLPPVPSEKLEVTVTGVAAASEAWELTDDAPRRVPLKRVAGGARLTLEGAAHVNHVVLTRDTGVMQKLGREALERQSPLRESKRALAALRHTRRSSGAARIPVMDPQFSWPPAAHCSASVGSTNLAPPRAAGPAAVNLLPEGDFEVTSAVRKAGWEIGCLPNTGASVELSPMGARSGMQGLKLVCPPSGSTSSVSTPSGSTPSVSTPSSTVRAGSARLWVVTPPLRLSVGQAVRIEGFAHASTPLAESRLLISDTLGGQDLGVEFQQTEDWTKFTLFRVATDVDPLRVCFALTGPGTVFLDDVRISPTRVAE